MAKFLVDESTGRKLFELMLKSGEDVKFVGEIMKGAADKEVLKFCEKEKRVLITDDKDFGELVFKEKIPVSGVILVRTGTTKAEARFLLLKELFKRFRTENKFIILKEEVIRIREIKMNK